MWKKKLLEGGFPVRDLLGPTLIPLIEEHHPEARSRIYPPETVVFAMVAGVISRDDTLASAVIRNNQDRLQQGLEPASVNTAAFAKARARLAPELLIESTRKVARDAAEQVPPEAFWCGFIPFAIDGSTLTADDTKANQKAFPQHGNQAPGIGFPLIRVVLLQCLSTGMVCDFAYGPSKGKETGEMALAREVLVSLPDKAILLGDCYFPSYFVLDDVMRRGMAGLFPMHYARDVDFRRGKQLHYHDHLVEWEKPQRPEWMTKKEYDSYPDSLVLRETDLSWQLARKGERFIVVTTLTDAERYPRALLGKMYKKRWKIEVVIRDLKSTFGMQHLAAQTPAMIEKTLWAHLLAYNALRWHMLNAALLFERPPDEVSVKTASRLLTEASHAILSLTAAKRAKLFSGLYFEMIQVRIGRRPDRQEPRAVKKRPKPTPLLKISRNDWRRRKCA